MLKSKRHFLNWIKENSKLLPIKEKWYILNWIKNSNSFDKKYQEVEYIESTDGAYILIDYYLKGITEIDLKVLYTASNTTAGAFLGNNTPVGAGTVDNPKYMFTASSTGKVLGFYYYNSTLNSIKPGVNVRAVERIQTKIEDGKIVIYINNEPYTDPLNDVKNFTCAQETGLFGVPARRKNQRLYYAKFYESGELKVSLIPCYRKSDGEIGLYDKVNNKFYTNQGTGEFIKGGNK